MYSDVQKEKLIDYNLNYLGGGLSSKDIAAIRISKFNKD